ncbi:MAG: DUF308 domain-containing protein [Sphingomonadaceae bacterium]
MALAPNADLNAWLPDDRWWALVLRGLAGIIFGIIAFLQPAAALLALVIVFGVFAIVDGVFALITAIGRALKGRRRGWLVVDGMVSIIIGIMLLALPGVSLAASLLILAIKAAVTGLMLIFASIKADGMPGQGWMIFGGLVNIAFAIALFLAPIAGLIVLTWWIAAWALVFGVTLVILGFRVRSAQKQ